MHFRNVAIVMISRNEEKSVKKVIRDIKKYVPGSTILLVDSSTDKTAIVAQKEGARVIRQFPPRGYGPAMEKALLTPRADIVVTMDCDNTYPVKEIAKLVTLIEKGYDVVGTSRLSKGKPKSMPLLNYAANKFFNYIASMVFLRNIRDMHTGMRAYKRKVLHAISWGPKGYVIPGLSLIKSGLKGNAFPVELLLKPLALGFKVIEIPIIYKERIGNSKLEKLDSALWTLLRIINSRLTVHDPLR